MSSVNSVGAGGFRPLKVVDKRRECSTITSLHLEPVNPADWRDFEPGQFLNFKLPAGKAQPDVLRNYSVSSAPGQRGRYRITVKRETEGIGSGYLHDQAAVGSVLLADGPRGAFCLDRTSTRAVLLLSGGVGLTPLVSMLHTLAAHGERRAVFIHACDNGAVHALGPEVRALAASRPGIEAHVVYRFPTDADRTAAAHQAEGVISRELLQQLLPLDDYECYLCGPPAFMQAMFGLLRGLGVAQERIAYEFFGPATVLESGATAPSPAAPPVAPPQPALAPAAADGITVAFGKSGRSVNWSEDAQSLLALAESHGLRPPFSCRAGVCGSCKTGLLAGEVSYFEEPLDDPGAGQVLICCARPKSSLVLDL